jgi:tetratricopeptide (TPR) repeat protein
MTTSAALDRRAWTPAAQAALGRARGDLPDARVNLRPPRAYALARLGRFSEAQAEIATTPLDCYRCVRRRAQIAALQGDARAADHWFAEADRLAPSLPFADTEWGEVLLTRGDPAGAVAKLAAAHAKSPRYADPLELWGEALMRQGRPEAAAAKFAEAAKYAPQWGRLHLMWGEALAGLGRAEEARARWRAAAAMDLSPDDRRRLAGWQMACNSGGGHLAPAGHTCRLELAKASPWGRG